MYAIVKLGAAQYQVSEGEVVNVHRMDYEVGKSINLDQVVLFVDGDDIRIGKPYLKDVKIAAKIVGEQKEKRVLTFKYRKRKDSSTQRGHRQILTALSITKISA